MNVKSICTALAAAVILPLAATPAGTTPLKVACIGDSITFGHLLPGVATNSYPAQLNRMLKAKHPGEYDVRGFGDSGRGVYLDTIRNAKTGEKRGYRHHRRHAAALKWKPDVVICNLGVNDTSEFPKEFTGERPAGQFVREYLELLDDYRKANPKVKFYVWTKLAPLADSHKYAAERKTGRMEQALEEVAAKAGATPIDMFTPFGGTVKGRFHRDGIHPNIAGATCIAEATLKVLEEQPTGDAAPAFSETPIRRR